MCDFSLDKTAGKNRATRQKLEALGKKDNVSLSVYSVKGKRFSIMEIILNEFRVILKAIRSKPDVIIARGVSGLFFQILKPFLNYKLVREVHAAGLEELKLLPFRGAKKGLAFLKLKISLWLDCKADLRIFNHPKLMEWYVKKYKMKGDNCFVYNGFDSSSGSYITQAEARKKFDIDRAINVLVFTGAASKWHGVDYLVNLQRCFNTHRDNVRIVCGGGAMTEYDPDGLCLNISPLDDEECADLIRAADACLLPVSDVRISPGSPLKLYDYMVNERPIIAQSDQLGYSDEVAKFQVGVSVDFRNTETARIQIVEWLEDWQRGENRYPRCEASWSDRIDTWLVNITAIL